MAIRFCMGDSDSDSRVVVLDSTFFSNAKRLFSLYNVKYLKVLDRFNNYVCHCYDDKHGDKYLFELATMKSSNAVINFFSRIEYVNIYSLNEISYEFLLLCLDAGCKVSVFGDLWEYLYYNTPIYNQRGDFELYSEGNNGLPIKEVGKWENRFPHNEYAQIDSIYRKFLESDSLYNKPIVDCTTAQHILSKAILSNKPFMASRLGNTESIVSLEHNLGHSSDYWIKWLYKTSGFYSSEETPLIKDVIKYIELTIASQRNCDINLCHFENSIFINNTFSPINSINLKWRDTYVTLQHSQCWLKSLLNKRVLIVSSINKTIAHQVMNFRKIHHVDFDFNARILYYDCPQTYFKENRKYQNWFETFSQISNDISNIDFDIALISAGAYGHPLAAFVKKLGKQAINICSGIYPLFGIRCKTQIIIRQISSLYNKYWIYPLESLNPNYLEIEKGGYWG